MIEVNLVTVKPNPESESEEGKRCRESKKGAREKEDEREG